jgi:magnesium-transporting ATPase (P-type)
MTVNIVAMFIVFAGAIIFADAPLTAVQMLWVNLIMDTFAALALATEAPSHSLLNREPTNKTELIVNATMWRNIIGQGIYQIVVLLLLLGVGPNLLSLPFTPAEPFYVDQAWLQLHPGLVLNAPTNKCILYTIVFQTFVFMQLFN